MCGQDDSGRNAVKPACLTNKQQKQGVIFDFRLREASTRVQQTPCTLTIRVPSLEKPYTLRTAHVQSNSVGCHTGNDEVQRGGSQDTQGHKTGPTENFGEGDEKELTVPAKVLCQVEGSCGRRPCARSPQKASRWKSLARCVQRPCAQQLIWTSRFAAGGPMFAATCMQTDSTVAHTHTQDRLTHRTEHTHTSQLLYMSSSLFFCIRDLAQHYFCSKSRRARLCRARSHEHALSLLS